MLQKEGWEHVVHNAVRGILQRSRKSDHEAGSWYAGGLDVNVRDEQGRRH